MTTTNALVKEYIPNPTPLRFHKSNKFFRVLKGPVGTGKSTACVFDILMRAMLQPPDVNKIRRSRWAIIRSTYPELKSTTIKTWQAWIPDSVCPIVYDIPIRGLFRQPLQDGTVVEMEVYFLALETAEDTGKLLSLELTGAWINEVSQIDEAVFEVLRGRVGRYPQYDKDRPYWSGIIADTNPPKTTHWIYRIFEQDAREPTFEMFTYPPAVYFDSKQQKWVPSPDAENLSHHKPDYYLNQIAGNSEDYIRVMLAGEYGMTRLGKVVFPQYSEREHVAREPIKPDRGLPLIIGFDFGLNPAAIFAQLSRRGKLAIVEELVPADVDLESFCDEYVLPTIQRRFAGFSIQCVGDPAARGRSGLDKRTPFDVLASRNLRCVPAPTNNFVPRKEAVDYFLNRREGFVLDPKLTYLREAFGGGYIYEKLKKGAGAAAEYKERPNKANPYSHGMDAVQYIALYVKHASGAVRTGRLLNGMGNDNTQKQQSFFWV